MKILHVAHFFYPCLSAGGVVNASYQIASKQSKDNDVKVISSDSCKERLKFPTGRYDVDVGGIKVDYFRNLSNRFKLATMLDTPFSAPFKIRKYIKKYEIKDKKIVVILPDTGERYLSSGIVYDE